MPKQVKVRNDTGGEWWIPEADVPAFVKQGYQVVTKGESMPGAAFGLGVARGLTMGASDLAIAYEPTSPMLAQEAGRGLGALREGNAGASMVGEVAGALPSALIGGPVGGIAKQGILKTAGQVAIESAIVGGIQPAITEAAVENKDLTAESVAQHMIGAAAVGGAFGLAGATVGKLFQKTADGVANSALLTKMEDRVSGSMRDSFLKGQLAKAGDLKQYGLQERWSDVVKFGDQEGIFLARDLEGVSEAAAAVNQKYMTKMDDLLKDLEAASPAVREAVVDPNTGQVLGSRLAQELRASPGYKAAKALSDEAAAPWVAAAQKLDEVFMVPNRTWVSVEKVAQEAAGGGYMHTTKTSITDEIREIIAKRLGSTGVAPTTAIDDLKMKMSQSMSLKNLAHDRFIEAENRFASSAQLGVPGILTFGARRAARFAATAAGRAELQSGAVPMLVARAMKSVGQAKVLSRGAGAFRDMMVASLDTLPLLTAPMRIALEKAAAEGADEFLDTHLQLASGPQGAQYLEAVGAPAGDVKGVGARLAALGSLQDQSDETADELDAVASRFIKGAGLVARPSGKVDYDKAVAAVRGTLKDPQALYESLPEHVRQHAPETAMLATQKLVEGAKFLEGKIPKGPFGEGAPRSMRPAYRPTVAEKAKFERYVWAVSNPAGAFQAMAQGRAAREHVEAMKAVYPETYARMGKALFEALGKLEKPLDYRKRLVLENTFGGDAVGRSDAEAAVLQNAHGAARAQKKEEEPQADGRQMVNNKGYESAVDRMASRRSQ